MGAECCRQAGSETRTEGFHEGEGVSFIKVLSVHSFSAEVLRVDEVLVWQKTSGSVRLCARQSYNVLG